VAQLSDVRLLDFDRVLDGVGGLQVGLVFGIGERSNEQKYVARADLVLGVGEASRRIDDFDCSDPGK